MKVSEEHQPRAWRVHWQEVSRAERLAWFQATRRNGSAPDEGQEVVEAEAFGALTSEVERLHGELYEARDTLADALIQRERQREALEKIMDELGVASEGYPTPVSNAIDLARAALTDPPEAA